MKRGNDKQLQLSLKTEEADPWISCRGIFSPSYLRNHLRPAEFFPSAEDAQPTYERIKKLWGDNLEGLNSKRTNERYTCTILLEPILKEMGWSYIPEQSLPSGVYGHKRPDFCLFTDPSERKQAAAADTAEAIFGRTTTVLEAKSFGHPLDRVSKRETPGLFPSQQIQDYLRNAKDGTGNRYFNWAILTNGVEWRLYCEQAAIDACFSFHLVNDTEFCSLEDFRLFLALFRHDAFELNAERRCRLDALKEESIHLQATLELKLRKRIFDVLEDLANGFRAHPANGIKEENYDELYQNSLIFLYRLLFILYAESRSLLPVRSFGAGSNKTYRENYSLFRLVNQLRDARKFTDDAFEDLYEQLLKVFHLINGDRPDQNRACRVTRYNGGLFNSDLHNNIEKWRIGDKSLANVLKQLIFAQPPARSTQRQQQIAMDETIDYGSLEVRQLGDIYEGLLGAHLDTEGSRLVLKNEKGQNHRQGIFYTPDWVVRFLVRESLVPLLDRIDASREVQSALKAKSEEKRRDNSFALKVLELNIVDQAMGSGHFLVRTTEWLAEKIFEHFTTRRMTEQIVPNGKSPRCREDIEKDGRIAVSPGLSQEQAELAYWRRRVVEACIYGVDLNPLAVELSKLSLWLTCIATDEPLNFLDHHLHHGNSLLGVETAKLNQAPVSKTAKENEAAFSIGDQLAKALKEVIAESVNIEETASTEMEVVKKKEARWKNVRKQIAPFITSAHYWLAALNGLPITDLDYRLLVLFETAPDQLTDEQKEQAQKLKKSLAKDMATITEKLKPFHWELEFPDVFFNPDGTALPTDRRGFDVVLGNPPYISTHTSSEQDWRNALEKKAGYIEDLYVHFTDLGFDILRSGGTFGFIVSDTFFTLASKARMRNILQNNRLIYLGQCDPFDATVDAAIFVAEKNLTASEDNIIFVQARPRKTSDGAVTKPESSLPTIPPRNTIPWKDKTILATPETTVEHAIHDCLRLHRVPVRLYKNAHKNVFFEPRHATLKLYERFNEPVKTLVNKWWDKIETSQKFADNISAIQSYHQTLKPGDITLVGLIAEGGQGMRTANNARFLGYLEDTAQAQEILARREKWTKQWMADAKIAPIFENLLKQNGGDPKQPTSNGPAWEVCVEPLKKEFTNVQLGFGKSDLYRIVPKLLVANDADFSFAWKKRKAALLAHWKNESYLNGFWAEGSLFKEENAHVATFRKAKDVGDADFCKLCQLLQRWVTEENERRKAGQRIPKSALGLKSSEDYSDPSDAPRIATIYNGFSGKGVFTPFRKGDPEGSRWVDNEPLCIEWNTVNVSWLFGNSGRPESGSPVIRNANLYFTEGVTWSAVANHVGMKARFQEACVFDADSMRLTPVRGTIHPMAFLAIFNSDVFSFIKMKFIKHTQKWEIGDLRQAPLVMPERKIEDRLSQLAEKTTECKRLGFADGSLSNEQTAFIREVANELTKKAPIYLRPPAQQILLATAEDGLAIIELAVNWEAEKLYGVEGLGPFDEF